MPRISTDVLTDFATALLHAGGVSLDEGTLVARSLVGANLRGHDSHGVMRIPNYLTVIKKKEAFAGAKFKVLKDSETILMADGNWGFGQTQAQRLTRLLIEKAQQSPVVIGTMIHSSHVGRLGEYCEMAAEQGLVSMVMVNTHGFARRVAPPGGTAPRLGTNPIAIGIPNASRPMILDFGTSATAEGKVRVKRIAGETCPDGWILDSDGKPTNDPNDLYADPPGSILPMGGSQAYKGFALGLMVEVFAGALSGGVCIREKPINQNGNCVYMQLINPSGLDGQDHFTSEIGSLFNFVLSCPTASETDEILLPGDPERKTLAQRTTAGIPLDEGNWSVLVDLAKSLNVPAPEVP